MSVNSMSAMQIAALLGLGCGAGVVGGMFGIGGGLIIVPFLAIAMSLPLKTAIGTSTFALLFPAGILAAREYYRNDNLDVRFGLLIAAGLFVGAYFGAKITTALSKETMKQIYGIFLVVIGCYYLFWPSPPVKRDQVELKSTAPLTYPDTPTK